jgi:hypothetical protein
MGPKKLPRDKQAGWVRTGGAIGDPSMDELDEFNRNGAGVEEKVKVCDADINADLPVKRQPGSED